MQMYSMPTISKGTYQRVQIVLLLVTLFVLFASFYFEYVQRLEPCPLCIMQRVCVFLAAIFCLIALCLYTLRRGRLVAFLQILVASAGLFFSLRQVWLQSLPAEHVSACMPGLDVLVHYFPWQDVARALLWGAADCAEVNWQWLGLSMPVWTALYFLLMWVANSIVFYRLGRLSQARNPIL